jgi:2-polyprenyl-3-methyl-5-hydroxy-6-metoxy-1,4-benzoquinol methylase
MSDFKAFLDALDKVAKVFAPSARATFEAHKELCSWLLDPLAKWAQAAFGKGVFEDAARGYAKYCMHVAKCQRAYEQAGEYKGGDLQDVISEVYENQSVMIPYMWAVILLYAFWPSRVNHMTVYRNEFLQSLAKEARVLDLASGHGVFALLAAEERPDIHVEGIDISSPAVALANRLLHASGHADRVRFEIKDALDIGEMDRGLKYQGIIASHLIEHLEDPGRLFKTITSFLADDGIVFFSVAIESPQRDQLYEFNHESEPLRMAEESGLRVTRLVSDAGKSIPGGQFRPRAMATMLRRH